MNREILFLVGTIILISIGIFFLYKYRLESLRAAAYYVVVQAEEHFISGQGREKLQFAIRELKKTIPWYISWLISEKFIIKLIEDVLKGLQETFKGSKEKQLTIVNKIIETATIGSSKEVFKVAQKMQKDINTKGFVEGYLEGRTDFRGNSNLAGGVRAGVKF